MRDVLRRGDNTDHLVAVVHRSDVQLHRQQPSTVELHQFVVAPAGTSERLVHRLPESVADPGVPSPHRCVPKLPALHLLQCHTGGAQRRRVGLAHPARAVEHAHVLEKTVQHGPEPLVDCTLPSHIHEDDHQRGRSPGRRRDAHVPVARAIRITRDGTDHLQSRQRCAAAQHL